MRLMKLTQAIVAVLATTVVAGVAGGVMGALVGRLAPSFVRWIHAQGQTQVRLVETTEFGFGLGVVAGMVLGVGAGSFLVAVLALRDAWLARAGVVDDPAREEDSAVGSWLG